MSHIDDEGLSERLNLMLQDITMQGKKIAKHTDIKDMKKYHTLKAQHPYLETCRIVSNSDAHYLEDINEPELTLELPEITRDAVIDLLGSRISL